MARKERASLLKWALQVLMCAGAGLAAYVGIYVLLMRRDLAAADEHGKLVYRSSFRFAPSVRVEGPMTVLSPAVSTLNTVFEPIDYCWRRMCGFISPIPENEPYAQGKVDPGRIKEIRVYLNPPGMFMAERYVDLGRCRRIAVAENGAAQELCQALSAGHSVLDKDTEETTASGTIEAVLDAGSVFLYFYVADNRDVYVCHPVSPSRVPESNGHGQNTLLPWLRRYVLKGSEQIIEKEL